MREEDWRAAYDRLYHEKNAEIARLQNEARIWKTKWGVAKGLSEAHKIDLKRAEAARDASLPAHRDK